MTGIKLGDVSSLAGIMTGKGLMGEAAGNGLLGAAPYFIAKDKQKDMEEEERRRAEAEGKVAPGMKCGGKVKMAKGGFVRGSVRGSGCAVRGVKKCKMR